MKALLFSILFALTCCTSTKVESAAKTCQDYFDQWTEAQVKKERVFIEPRVIAHTLVFSSIDTTSKIQHNILFTPGNHRNEAGENFVGFCLPYEGPAVTVSVFDFALPEPKKI